jgi:tRNA-Thr(GGU) m(6)t(6)A37 methyltransferase TsaA
LLLSQARRCRLDGLPERMILLPLHEKAGTLRQAFISREASPPTKTARPAGNIQGWSHMLTEIIFRPIGTVRSPFKEPPGTPIQPSASPETQGVVELFPEYQEGLQDLEGFSHLILLYCFHLSQGFSLKVKPFLDEVRRGLFATRAPARPNPIGLSVVRLERIDGTRLYIREVDVVDGTPLLDIKPYVPRFDSRPEANSGWLAENLDRLESARDDGRFLP